MEFHVKLMNTAGDIDALRESLQGIDPGALVDFARDRRALQVLADTTAGNLAGLASLAGFDVTPADVLEVPAFCCGGCGG